MDSVRLWLDVDYGDYTYFNLSNIKMIILASFFTSDVVCHASYFGKWCSAASDGDFCRGNTTSLEIDGDFVVLTDSYPEVPAEVRMTRQQFVKLFDEWQEKVCKNKPRELFIIHDNGEYFIKVTKQ